MILGVIGICNLPRMRVNMTCVPWSESVLFFLNILKNVQISQLIMDFLL